MSETRRLNIAEAAARLRRSPATVTRLCRTVKGLQAIRVNGHWELTESDVEALRSIVGTQLSLFDGAENHGKH